MKTLADKLSVTQAEAMRFVQAWEETTTEALESDGSLMLLGFGTLSYSSLSLLICITKVDYNIS